MLSFKPFVAGLCLAASFFGVSQALAAPLTASGFNVERLFRAPAGTRWWAMDDLAFAPQLGGALNMSLGYAHAPLRVSDADRRFSLVSSDFAASFAAAIAYDRWRLHVDMGLPLAIVGQSGTVGGIAFLGPVLTPSALPDPISDMAVGLDARLWGSPQSSLRLGASASLIIPSGRSMDYDTDGTFRGMLRALAAGDTRWLQWAGHLGAHIRPLHDGLTPGGPQGHELLFGAALGTHVPLGAQTAWRWVIGPEFFGATAFDAFFTHHATAFEGLLATSFENSSKDGVGLRIKAGCGMGLHAQFGAPTWRIALGIEIFGAAEAKPTPTR